MIVLLNCISKGLCSEKKKCVCSVFFKEEVCLVPQILLLQKSHICFAVSYIMGTKLSSTVNFMWNPYHKKYVAIKCNIHKHSVACNNDNTYIKF